MEKKFTKCDECCKPLLLSSTLKNHKLLHIEKKVFKCDKCGKQFSKCAGLILLNSDIYSTERRIHFQVCFEFL